MILGYKVYTNPKFPQHINTCYYLTLNGVQIGGVLFSMRAVLEAMEKVKRGEPW